MFRVKVKEHQISVSPKLVVRTAERLWRLSPEVRDHAAEAARKRLDGDRPRKQDAAIVVAMRGV